jgi:hypothetical protein
MFPGDLDLEAAIRPALLTALKNGGDADHLIAAIPDAIGVALSQAVDGVVDSLGRRRAAMIREHARERRAFERHLRTRWGKGLDRYYAVVIAVEEAGADFNRWIRRSQTFSDRADALTRILALACQVAKEIYTLLVAGYRAGAAARWRTLHELAVTAIVLGEQEEKYSGRFLAYVDVETWHDAQQYQLHAAKLGQQPLSKGEIAAVRGRYDAAVNKFGNEFAASNGWAFPLFAPKGASFEKLEDLAGVSHLRPYYKFSTHHAHGGSKGVMGNTTMVQDRPVLLTGATDSGFAEIAHGALISLMLTATSLLIRGHDVAQNPMAIVVAQALRQLVTDAGAALRDAELNYTPPPPKAKE